MSLLKLQEYISNRNWERILNYCKVLSDAERYRTITDLHGLNLEKDILKAQGIGLEGKERDAFYANKVLVSAAHNYALICCLRSAADIAKIAVDHGGWSSNALAGYLGRPDLGIAPLLAFFKLFPPDYLNKTIRSPSNNRFLNTDFRVLWALYNAGYVEFEEEFFVRNLFSISMFSRDTVREADFLLNTPGLMDDVVLQFYKYDVPVLDTSKWTAREGHVCKRVTEFWTEVFVILSEKGYVFDRSILLQLLESLFSQWKKPRLDWHLRLLQLLRPSTAEYLKYQSQLFLLFDTGNTSLINFAVKQINSIYKEADFDVKGFTAHITTIFIREKCGKAILTALGILEYFLLKPDFKMEGLADELSILFLQADPMIQEKTAKILVRHTEKETLQGFLLPYMDNLKQKAKDILEVDHVIIDIEEEQYSNVEQQEFIPVHVPANWEELLFKTGDCIRTKSALETDLFIEGLNQLRDELPADYKKQLKPYVKQLLNRFWDSDVMSLFADFMYSFLHDEPMPKLQQGAETIPFLHHKLRWLKEKLASGNRMPFLSTPSHLPFYIHPKVLVSRLLDYEAQNIPVEPEDLIVACNRLLYRHADEETLRLAGELKGNYASAIHYYLDKSDRIEPVTKCLALWAQVTRIKDPNGRFDVFGGTALKDYPAVCDPFIVDFDVVVEKSVYATWYQLKLDNDWNFSWYSKKNITFYPQIYYHTAPFRPGFRDVIPYQGSLTPQYLDGWLCRFIPSTASGNEVMELEQCLLPLQFLLEHDLRVYHSGWIYIAVCLLFEKRVSRDLAAEYIRIAILERNEWCVYLAEVTGKLISRNFAPVNRLIEYLDKPHISVKIKEFQFLVLEKCIVNLNPEKLPLNSRKILAYYKEWAKFLDREPEANMFARMKLNS